MLATGRDQLIFAGLWNEMCVACPELHARGEGGSVYVVGDACRVASGDDHDRAMRCMVQAGVSPMTARALLGELQRDWARRDGYAAAAEIASRRHGKCGQSIRFHHQLATVAKSHTGLDAAVASALGGA